MTGRERLLIALNGKPTDRVPVTLFIQSQGHFVRQLAPNIGPWDFISYQKAIVDYQRSFGVDVHIRRLFFDSKNPIFTAMYMLNFSVTTPEWQVKEEVVQREETKELHHTITTPEGVITQVFAINEGRSGIFMYSYLEPPIKSPEDTEIAMKYEPDISDETKESMKNYVKTLKDYIGDDCIISA